MPQGYAMPRQQPRPQQPAATARGQSPSAPTPPPTPRRAAAPLSIPTPEQLGVGAAKKPATAAARREDVDWAATRKRLQEMGAVSFRLDQLPDGGARFQVWLPAQASAVQADGASEADAVRDCLARARTQVASSR